MNEVSMEKRAGEVPVSAQVHVIGEKREKSRVVGFSVLPQVGEVIFCHELDDSTQVWKVEQVHHFAIERKLGEPNDTPLTGNQFVDAFLIVRSVSLSDVLGGCL